MKKTYISPEFLFVELRGIQMLAESVRINNTTIQGSKGGWAKEENSSITDTNVWDEEW